MSTAPTPLRLRVVGCGAVTEYVSGVSVYDAASVTVIDEDSPLLETNPRDLAYAQQKLATERLVLDSTDDRMAVVCMQPMWSTACGGRYGPCARYAGSPKPTLPYRVVRAAPALSSTCTTSPTPSHSSRPPSPPDGGSSSPGRAQRPGASSTTVTEPCSYCHDSRCPTALTGRSRAGGSTPAHRSWTPRG
jgi:hypothetical protein